MVEETVQIILTGICTFVGAGVGSNGRPVTAVFANATHHEPKHHVSLIVSADDYSVDSNMVVNTEYSEMGKQFHVVLLDGKSIAIAGLRGEKLVLNKPPLSEEAKRLHRPTTMTELESVQWIPSLGRSWPRMFPMRPARSMRLGFYSVAADPQLVSSFMEMPKGKLFSHWVSGDVWKFGPRSRTRFGYETALAQEVRYEATIGGSTLHFDFCEFPSKRHCGFVRITRKNRAPKEPIEVMIANVPDEDRLAGSIVFCGECGQSECKDRDGNPREDPFPCTCVDHHYASYYQAMKTRVPERPSLPRRIGSWPPLIPVALRVGGGNCPPSDYP